MVTPTVFETITDQDEATDLTGLFVAAESQVISEPTKKVAIKSILNKSADIFNYDGLIYQGVGNISDFAGQQLQEPNKTNAYQYPDNSRQFYGADKSQSFPITIPADPSSDDGWVLVTSLTGDWGGIASGTQVKHRRGTSAEIAAGVPAIGESWFNITDNTIHIGDGATQGGIKQKDFVNVKNFGAKGNGVTDDAAAINACFQSMTNGGTVYFPEGVYFIGQNITPLDNTTIQGSGNSIIKLKDHTVSVLFEFTTNNKMFNMKVDGNYLEWLVPDNFVVSIRNCFDFFMEYCEVYNGYGVGIGIGRGNHPASERVTIQNCIVHDMGSYTHPVITNPWANGIANTVGKDVKIVNNYIYDIWGTGGINCEGLVNENILIADNTIFDIHEDCAAIKLYAGGADQHPKNVVIRNNQLYNINDTIISPTQKEPAIWVSSGEDVQIIGNTISDCIHNDAISANPTGTLIIDGNIIKRCPEGRIRAAASQHIKVTNNIIDCPDGAVYENEAPLWVESNTTPADGTCIVKGNSITNSPLNAAWINFGSTAGEFTGNSFFNCHKDVGSPTVLVGTKDNWRNSIIGNNIISANIGSVTSRLTYFYSLSGNKLGGGVLLPDAWNMTDDTHEGIKYDVGSNTEFFQTDLALFSAPPTAGYNQRSQIVYNASPDVGDPIGWVCRLTGTPGTWNGFGQIMP